MAPLHVSMSKKAILRYPQTNLAACFLPWTASFRLDRKLFEAHVQETLAEGYSSLYITGTAGEGYALSDEQFKEVVGLFAKLAVRRGLDPQVGVISLSMSEMIARIAWARDQGIRMFQIALPSWSALDEGERKIFFATVCGKFPDCRFLHYNLPRAKHIVTGAEYARLAKASSNLVATKNSTSDYRRVAELMTNAPTLQHFLTESSYAFGCMLGECSLLCSFGSLFPETTKEFYRAGCERDHEVLRRTHVFLNQVEGILFGHCARDMIDGSYDKALVWLRHPQFPYRVLPPYLGLDASEAKQCRAAYRKHFAATK
ncbi:MAG: hypothetical protein JWM32_2422 [Verrucomicrobia bacterium]|nr:hypothetical protein [Verrucomicrobiota bacterium]